MRKIKLFIGFCLICGLLIVASSIAGSKMIRPNGIFTGAIVGGLIGIMIASKIAVYISLVRKSAFKLLMSYSAIGLIFAILISMYNLKHPVILVLSASLIGLGALLGDYLDRKSQFKTQ